MNLKDLQNKPLLKNFCFFDYKNTINTPITNRIIMEQN